jgi:hypothetical protein
MVMMMLMDNSDERIKNYGLKRSTTKKKKKHTKKKPENAMNGDEIRKKEYQC